MIEQETPAVTIPKPKRPKLRNDAPIEDILAFLIIEEPSTLSTGCWRWPRGKTKGGYGETNFQKKKALVHRIVYQHFVGPIPVGMEIDHLCRNRWCANFEHLEAVPPKVNNERGESACAQNSRKTHCVRGHPYSGDNLRIGRNGGRWCRACAKIHKEKEKAKLALIPKVQKPPKPTIHKTHCPQGHPYSGYNLCIDPKTGSRNCRTCHNEKSNKRYWDKKIARLQDPQKSEAT